MTSFQRFFYVRTQKEVWWGQVGVFARPWQLWFWLGSGVQQRRCGWERCPRILDLTPNAVDPLFQSFSDFYVSFGTDFLPRCYHLEMDHPFSNERDSEHESHFRFAHSSLFGEGATPCAVLRSAFSFPGHIQRSMSHHLSKKLESFSHHGTNSSQSLDCFSESRWKLLERVHAYSPHLQIYGHNLTNWKYIS